MSVTNNINYLQPSGFRVLVDRTRFANFTFFCQTVTHPNVSATATEVPFRQYASVPQPGDTFTYGTLEMSVILDEDMMGYTEILNWMKNNVNLTQNVDDPEPSVADLTLSILSSKNTINKQIKYIDAFPTDIGSITLETTSSDTQVLSVPITFRYTYFELS
jgi:hypothetical protein